jgi:hypothetical protein
VTSWGSDKCNLCLYGKRLRRQCARVEHSSDSKEDPTTARFRSNGRIADAGALSRRIWIARREGDHGPHRLAGRSRLSHPPSIGQSSGNEKSPA